MESWTNHMVNINKWNIFLNHQGVCSSYELCSLAPNELWRWVGTVTKTVQLYTGCDFCVTTVITIELNNCFSNYRCCETTVKATVCSWLLRENAIIECSTQQINDMVFATWQQVLIIIGKGGLLHIDCKHQHDLMKWSQFSHFTAKSLKKKKHRLTCSCFSSHPVGKSSKENYTVQRGCPRGVTPINTVIFHVWIVISLWWRKHPKNVLSVLSFLSSGDCLTHWFFPCKCQHLISSCSMHWYFKDSVSTSKWAALACFDIFY